MITTLPTGTRKVLLAGRHTCRPARIPPAETACQRPAEQKADSREPETRPTHDRQ